MPTSIAIFSKANEYVKRNITLRDLESWVVSMLPIYLINPDSAAALLASRIELGLAEIQAGITTERTFRRLLMRQINQNQIITESYPSSSSFSETTSSVSISDTTVLGWMDLSPSSNNALQVEYV